VFLLHHIAQSLHIRLFQHHQHDYKKQPIDYLPALSNVIPLFRSLTASSAEDHTFPLLDSTAGLPTPSAKLGTESKSWFGTLKFDLDVGSFVAVSRCRRHGMIRLVRIASDLLRDTGNLIIMVTVLDIFERQAIASYRTVPDDLPGFGNIEWASGTAYGHRVRRSE
jgi:hypothetical protein